jgi:hypothetical protein
MSGHHFSLAALWKRREPVGRQMIGREKPARKLRTYGGVSARAKTPRTLGDDRLRCLPWRSSTISRRGVVGGSRQGNACLLL